MDNSIFRQKSSNKIAVRELWDSPKNRQLVFLLLCMKSYQTTLSTSFYRIFGFINVLELVNQTQGMNCHYARPPYKSPSPGDSFSLHNDTVILHESRPHVIKDQGSSEIRVIAAVVPVGMHKRTKIVRNCFSIVVIKPRTLCILSMHSPTGVWPPAGS